MIDVDVELDRIATDLATAGYRTTRKVVAVTQRGAGNVTRDARQFASGLAHAPQYPASIGFDLNLTGGMIEAEIGPDKDRPQGALGNLLEYGSVNNPPNAHHGPALDREAPSYVAHVAAVADPW